jgi:hypothetical protein
VRPAAAAPTRPIEQVEQHRREASRRPASRARVTTASSVNGALFDEKFGELLKQKKAISLLVNPTLHRNCEFRSRVMSFISVLLTRPNRRHIDVPGRARPSSPRR